MAKRKKKRPCACSLNPRPVSAKKYTAMIRKLAKYKKERQLGKWVRLARKAHSARKRMIASNRSEATAQSYPRNLKKRMPAGYRLTHHQARKTKQGRGALRLYKRFWGIPYPPSIQVIPGDGSKKVTWLAGMGDTPEVHLSSARRGKKGIRTVLKGRWKSAVSPDGRIMILSGKAFKGQFRFVGFAPETHYIPTRAMERAGTFKRGKHWRHKHHDDGGIWPPVFADNNGKLSARSNFIYGRGTYKIGKEGWIER